MNKGSLEYSTDDLVSEQRGLRWVLIGLFIGLVLGLIFRATFSPENLSSVIRGALQESSQDMEVTFETAEVQLADGFLPDVSLVISNLRLSSPNECWGQPALDANELRVPLSLRELFLGRLQFRAAKLDQVDLTFFSDFKTCKLKSNPDFEKADGLGNKFSSSSRSVAQANVQDEESHRRLILGETELEVSIRSLVIRLPDEAKTVLVFEKSYLTPDGAGNHRFEGNLRLGREQNLRESTSRAMLIVDYFAGPMKLNFSIDGNWREGVYKAQGEYSIKDRQWKSSGQIKNLPLSSVMPVLHHYQLIESQFGSGEMWLSADFKSPSEGSKGPAALVHFTNLSMEGDWGDLTADQFEVKSFKPFEFEPVTVSLRGLKIGSVLDFLKVENRSPMVAEWGLFNGKIHAASTEDVHLEGEHSGMELIFSNRGQRQNQILSLMVGKADLVKGRWLFRLDTIRPLDGLFMGDVNIQYLPSTETMTAEIQLDEMSLSPEVQKLMTSGGSLGRWSGALSLSTVRGAVTAATGEMVGVDLLVEGVGLERLQATMRSRGKNLQFDLKARNLKLQDGAVSEWLTRFLELKLPVSVPMSSARIEARSGGALAWRISPITVSGQSLRSEGGWNSEGVLRGSIRVDRNTGADSEWSVLGSRVNPEFKAL